MESLFRLRFNSEHPLKGAKMNLHTYPDYSLIEVLRQLGTVDISISPPSRHDCINQLSLLSSLKLRFIFILK